MNKEVILALHVTDAKGWETLLKTELYSIAKT
jgi:hypothetical protein